MDQPIIKLECDNCEWIFEGTKTAAYAVGVVPMEESEGLSQRLDPGSVVPFGECAVCHCWCYLVEPTTAADLRAALRLIVSAYKLARKSNPANLRRAIQAAQPLLS